MPTDRQLLTVTALAEAPVGLALLVAPGVALMLLLGVEPDSVGQMIGRVTGVALVALAISCWGARTDPGGPARSSTLLAITLYSAGAALLLIGFAVAGLAHGLVLWGAVAIHLALATGFTFSLLCHGQPSHK